MQLIALAQLGVLGGGLLSVMPLMTIDGPYAACHFAGSAGRQFHLWYGIQR